MDYRKLWIDYYGEIPKDKEGRSYEIHHIDGNRKNNDISNLKCLSIQEHYNLHKEQGDWMACNRMRERMKLSQEDRLELNKKISLLKKGKPSGRRGNGRTGTKHSEETKKKMSEVKKGKPQPWVSEKRKGCKLSEETKKKIGEFPRTEEHRKKISEGKKGKPWSEARRLAQKQTKD